MKISRELSPEEHRELVKTLTSVGWGIIKVELEKRRTQLAKDIIYSTDRAKDVDRRAGIVAIDMLLGTEADILTAPEPEQPYAIPEIYSANRY